MSGPHPHRPEHYQPVTVPDRPGTEENTVSLVMTGDMIEDELMASEQVFTLIFLWLLNYPCFLAKSLLEIATVMSFVNTKQISCIFQPWKSGLKAYCRHLVVPFNRWFLLKCRLFFNDFFLTLGNLNKFSKMKGFSPRTRISPLNLRKIPNIPHHNEGILG